MHAVNAIEYGQDDGERLTFRITRAGRIIPALLWRAPDGGAGATPPLVALQHGGAGHKSNEVAAFLARLLRDGARCSVLLIDGPVHGERRLADDPSSPPTAEAVLDEFRAAWAGGGDIDAMVEDWSAALNVAVENGWADPRRMAWVGLSMGAAYGIPLCARDPRFAAAILGMWGTNWPNAARLLEDAASIDCPVLFQIKLADELFPLKNQRELFDALSASQKEWREYPGGHFEASQAQLADMCAYLVQVFENDARRAPSS